MTIPLVQTYRIARYILEQKLKGNKKYPLVLMLEPLFRCNLECAGCGKIQFPKDVLKKHLTPEQCWAAADECGAPVVSIPGGEPLLHPQIDEIAAGLVTRKKFVYLCTNAIKPSGFAKRPLCSVITPPFGPASTFAIPAERQRPLISMTSSKCVTSSGNGPNRSTSSAANASMSARFSKLDRRR